MKFVILYLLWEILCFVLMKIVLIVLCLQHGQCENPLAYIHEGEYQS